MAGIDLRGLGVALITPFKEDFTVDFPALARLVEHQINGGVDYIVALGTTGEAATLWPEEQAAVRDFVVERVADRVPVVLGVGGNNTMAVVKAVGEIDLSPYAAILSVVPYYNKPSQEGIYQHYKAIATRCPGTPILLYNVPGRTGVNMTADTCLRLARDFDNIAGVKEASGNISQVNEIIKGKPDDFLVISGDDGVTLPLISMGAAGVISVVGNALPNEFSRMVRLALGGRCQQALKLHHRFTELFSLLFVDGNPAGVKCLLHAMGYIENVLRLPLVPVRQSTGEKIAQALKSFQEI